MTEEHYQDGIKLPTDKDISTWKEKAGENVTFARAKIEGGHLYYLLEGNGVCFVPDNKPELSEDDTFILMNKVAELSMKLNKMQDSLREFEKQKVEPLKLSINLLQENDDCATNILDNLEGQIEGLSEHIEKIYERIQKLEEHHTRQIDENRKVSNLINAMDNDMFNLLSSRIEKLEERADLANECFVKLNNKYDEKINIISDINSNIFKRIEKLESIFMNYKDIVEDRKEYQQQNMSQPRNKVKLCPHGNPIEIICTACY